MNDEYFMKKAIALAAAAVAHGNEPFGAVLVKDGEIIFSNENQIYTRHDPTFHGEAAPRQASPTCGSTPCTPAASRASCAAALWSG